MSNELVAVFDGCSSVLVIGLGSLYREVLLYFYLQRNYIYCLKNYFYYMFFICLFIVISLLV